MRCSQFQFVMGIIERRVINDIFKISVFISLFFKFLMILTVLVAFLGNLYRFLDLVSTIFYTNGDRLSVTCRISAENICIDVGEYFFSV